MDSTQQQRRRSRLSFSGPAAAGPGSGASDLARRLSDSIVRANNDDKELSERVQGLLKDPAAPGPAATRRKRLGPSGRRQSLPSLTVDTNTRHSGPVAAVSSSGGLLQSRPPRSRSSVSMEGTTPGAAPTGPSSPVGSPPSHPSIISAFPLHSPLAGQATSAVRTETREPCVLKSATEDVAGSPLVADTTRKTNTLASLTPEPRTLSEVNAVRAPLGGELSGRVSTSSEFASNKSKSVASTGDIEDDGIDITEFKYKPKKPCRAPSKSFSGLLAPTPVDGQAPQQASGCVKTDPFPSKAIAGRRASIVNKSVSLGDGIHLEGVKLIGELELVTSARMDSVASSLKKIRVEDTDSESEATISEVVGESDDESDDESDGESAPPPALPGLALPNASGMQMPPPRRDRDRNAILDMDYNARRHSLAR